MNSYEYWQNREADTLKNYIKDEVEFAGQITAIYNNQLNAVDGVINEFYGRYASSEGITIAEAKKRVSQVEIERYEKKAEKYVAERNFSKKANEEMRLYNATMRINRFEMLKANIGLELIAGHDELEKYMAGILKGRTEEELERQAGILGETIRNNAVLANAIPNASFHNATFSDRVWQYQDLLKADLAKALQTGLIQGKNPRALAKDIKKYFVGADGKGGAAYAVERLLRTELARVQTEAQKQSFEKNGFTKYMFIVNGGCCPICEGVKSRKTKYGIGIYLVDSMMPGLNAPPMHPNCRCSVAAYESDDDYDEWLEFLANGGTTAEYNKYKADKALKLVYPKGFKDTRTTGTPITEEQLAEFEKMARKNNVFFSPVSEYGGFENFNGDFKILMETVKSFAEAQKFCPVKSKKPIMLSYDYIKDDAGRVDVNSFAMTSGRQITLNKFMYDSLDFAKIYKAEEKAGFFVKGSTYKHVLIHEYGHILENHNKHLLSDVVDILEEMAYNGGKKMNDYLVENISQYATSYDGYTYTEVVAELYSQAHTNDNQFALDILRKAGLKI